MPEINKQQAKQFLEDISPKDKVAIIHHDDADGFCSGILFNDHCISKGATTKTFTYIYGKTPLKNFDLKSFNKIIITDISTKMLQEEIKLVKNKQIFYTDHHPKFPLPKKILSLLTTDEGYIPSSRTAYELTKRKKWLAIIGVISDAGDFYKENDSFINDFLKEQNLTINEFKTKYAHPLSNTMIYFANTPEKILPLVTRLESLQEITKLKKYSDKVENEIQRLVKQCEKEKEKLGDINFYYTEPKYQVKGIIAAIMARQNKKEAHIFVSPKSSNKKFLGISSRHDSQNANLPKLLETATKNLPNSACGGHLRASGGRIRTQDLEKFKQNLKNYSEK